MASISKSQLTEIFERYQEIQNQTFLPLEPELTTARLQVMVENSLDKPQEALEKIRGTNNLTSVATFLRGFEVSMSVGLIYDRRKPDMDRAAIGTGFLVAPGILITNHHVIASKEEAQQYGVLMNYQRNLEGNLSISYAYAFAPDELFYTHAHLDFTVVKVVAQELKQAKKPITDFGYLRLIEESGKITKGEFAALIEHPNGKPKQVVLFENAILYDRHPDFLLYSTDTDEGASGSPVFNYEWVVVALHHAGVPSSLDDLQQLGKGEIDENEYPKAANEGIRISAIMKHLKENHSLAYELIIKAALDPLTESIPVQPFLDARPLAAPLPSLESLKETKPMSENKESIPSVTNASSETVIHLNIPLEIKIGLPQVVNAEAIVVSNELEKKTAVVSDSVNRNIKNREGYKADFLEGFPILLESLYKPFADKKLIAPTLQEESELKYVHFSVVMHKVRRMCLLTAVNMDGQKMVKVPRNDNWQLDGRMDVKYQLGNAVYANNDLDRGHMVRREDPNWGPDAKTANDDTFHYTNSCPQHKDLNQKTWLNLEDYVLNSAKAHQLKVSVFTGPVLDENYVHYREALVPAQFYKIVAMVKTDGTPSVTGYILTQKEMISGLERVMTDFVFGAFKTYQISLEKLEEITGLDLSSVKAYDPLNKALESVPREIEEAGDLVL
ncbi:DNA/RNA non-specific endonuclease [Siphonobacter sp. SORGH_AS_0500]|uniref:DNA/RNA non-specific endonuclease n=1 Tax=Siphonobacter sp. SORGH_AS_0500 TaxID=1864824 RepID=UPI002854D30E|nr:DNA/RNA non-specific endonuclease [Siphonobacter sp. SORGH_AS_0500]MDR6197468.1 endonuclease G [Siphonobacter sp. SORGH_AS_0500]